MTEWLYVKDTLPQKSDKWKVCSEDLIFITNNNKRYFGYFNSRGEFEAYNNFHGRFKTCEVKCFTYIDYPVNDEVEK